MYEERNSNFRNLSQTPQHPSCRLCHYAGYSNLCTFSQGGECPYASMRRMLSREKSEAVKEIAA